jgi:DNA-binding MarR family transcriptional regulator
VRDAPWLDDTEMRAWRSLLGAHRRVLQRLDADLLAAQELSVADYGVLVELSEAPDCRMRMSELAERMLLSPSGLTRRLDTMVAAGLVERLRCPTDRRGAYAVLTAAGRVRLEQAAPDHVEQVRRHFVERLSRTQLVALADALEAVCEADGCDGPR